MFQKNIRNTGFTIVEILIVITILLVILAILLVGFQNFSRFQQYNQAVSDVEFLLKQARVDGRSAVVDESHGVKFETSSIIRFVGSSYLVSDPDNIVTDYSLVTITPNLTGGTDEIIFAKLTGLPSATGTILIEGVNFSGSTTVTISDSGVIE